MFEGRFRSSIVQSDEYFLACLQYIELNPVRAGMVNDPGDYYWSSYRSHAFGAHAKMWSAHPNYLSLGKCAVARQSVYRDLVSKTLDSGVVTKIRHCVNTGLILGTESFRNQVAALRK